MGERRSSAVSTRIEDRIREVFMTRPQSRQRGEMTAVSARQEAVRSAKLAEAMQRQVSPPRAEDGLSEKIADLRMEFEAQVRALEEELKRKVEALRRDLEAKIARETADWSRRQAAKQPKATSRPFSTPRVRSGDSEEEESKPKENVRTALQRLQESKLKLSEYQTLLRTPTRTPQAATAKCDTLPKQVEDSYSRRAKATPQSETKVRAEDLPVRPKSLYERILALQKKG